MSVRTPLLPLGQNLFVKMESVHPSGTLYDRAVLPMIQANNKENATLLLADWGPFALATAWTAVWLKRKLELWLPEDAPTEFVQQLKCYPFQLHQAKLPLEDLQQQIRELAALRENTYQLLDPCMDPEHPMAYSESLAEEIWQQTDGELSALVSSCDSCACLMGCAVGLKQKNPSIWAVATPISTDLYGNHDPLGRAEPEFYVPQLCDFLAYCSLEEARWGQEELFRRCGLTCGLLGGAAYHGARDLQKEFQGKIVMILPSRYASF